MEINQNKMDPEKKYKLIYSVELLVFSVVFLVLGILEIINVIHISQRYALIFRWITIFGSTWLVADFIWALCSKKRRKRIALIDKIVMLPLALYVLTYDIMGFVMNPPIDTNYAFYRYGMSSVFLYIACVYIFEGIYHWFHPVPGLLDDLKEDKKDAPQEVVDQPLEEEQPALLNGEPIEEEKDKEGN